MSFLQHAEFRVEGVPNLDYRVVQAIRQAYAQLYALDNSTFDAIAKLGHSNALLAVVLQDTHVNRALYPAADYALGSFFYETDRTVVYLNATVKDAHAWIYLDGTMHATQANRPTDLGTNDTNFLLDVTDYAHLLKWSGSVFGWAPGDSQSGFLKLFDVDPTGPGWQLYDGSTVNYLKSDGTTGSITLPDLTSAANKAAYLKAGTPNAGPTAATAPGLSGSTASAFIGITINATTAETPVTPVPVAAASYTDPGHTHTKGTLAVDNTGEPRNLERRPFFRQ